MTDATKAWAERVVGLLLTISGGVGVTALAPPGSDGSMARFVSIVVASAGWLVALMAVSRWCPRASEARIRLRIAILAALSMPVCVGPCVFYSWSLEAWTEEYSGSLVVVGDELTAAGEAYFDREPQPSAQAALWDNAGIATEIWTEPSIERRELILWISFLTSIGCAAFVLAFCGHAAVRFYGEERRTRVVGPSSSPG